TCEFSAVACRHLAKFLRARERQPGGGAAFRAMPCKGALENLACLARKAEFQTRHAEAYIGENVIGVEPDCTLIGSGCGFQIAALLLGIAEIAISSRQFRVD